MPSARFDYVSGRQVKRRVRALRRHTGIGFCGEFFALRALPNAMPPFFPSLSLRSRFERGLGWLLLPRSPSFPSVVFGQQKSRGDLAPWLSFIWFWV